MVVIIEYRPQSNGQAKRMVRVLKDGLKCFYPAKSSLQFFMQRLLFVHRSTTMRGGKSPSDILMERQIRCPILSEYQPMQKYRANAHQVVQSVEMLFRKGNKSLVAYPNSRTVVDHGAQLTSAPDNFFADQRVNESPYIDIQMMILRLKEEDCSVCVYLFC